MSVCISTSLSFDSGLKCVMSGLMTKSIDEARMKQRKRQRNNVFIKKKRSPMTKGIEESKEWGSSKVHNIKFICVHSSLYKWS